MSIRSALRSFVEKHIIADDPYPEYSRLDRLDGLGRGPEPRPAPVPAYSPIWPHDAAALLEQIERHGLTDEDGQPFTLRTVDYAIQSAAESWCDREGVPRGGTMPSFDYGSQRWDEIIEDVLGSLALDYDEVYEVLPS